MPIVWKSFGLGFLIAMLLVSGVLAGLVCLSGRTPPPLHTVLLPSGDSVQVMSFQLTWGVDHSDRNEDQDQIALEYVSASPNASDSSRIREIAAVFGLIQPVSERWGLRSATVCAFPTTERKGRYDIYRFSRSGHGEWTHTRENATVFANDR